MNPEAIFQLMDNKIAMLSRKNHELLLLGESYVISEREYRIELAKKMYRLKEEKTPTTIMRDLSRGDINIAELRSKRDLSKIKYEACKAELNNIKIQIEVCRSKLAWLKEELKNS